MNLRSFTTRLGWLTAFGVAFGYLEGVVVVYLREIYYPEGFGFPLAEPAAHILTIELGRELATLIMLWAVAKVAGGSGWDRFAIFSFLFGVWDIAFYVTLRLVLGWPESIFTWDVLFLIPLVWTGPVLTPALVAACLIVAGTMMMKRVAEGVRPFTRWWLWAGAGLSLGLLLYSFTANHGVVRVGGVPESFPWVSYSLGLFLGWAVFGVVFYARSDEPSS